MLKQLLFSCLAAFAVLPCRAVTYLELHRGQKMVKSYFIGSDIMLKDVGGFVSGTINVIDEQYIMIGERRVNIGDIRKVYVNRRSFKYADKLVIAGVGYPLINLANSLLGYQPDGRLIEPRTAYISGALILTGLFFLRFNFRRYHIGGKLGINVEDYEVR